MISPLASAWHGLLTSMLLSRSIGKLPSARTKRLGKDARLTAQVCKRGSAKGNSPRGQARWQAWYHMEH
jgi:hypothetical protein